MDSRGELGSRKLEVLMVKYFQLLRRRHTNTTGKGLCVSLRSLRSLRLKKYNEANLLANLIADLLFWETQSSQRAQRNAKRVGVEVGEKRWRWRVDDKFFLLRRRHINTTGKGLCVSLRSLRSLRLKNNNEANLLANQIADLLFWETQSSQRAQRNAKRVGVGLDVCDAREERYMRRRPINTTGKGLCVSLRSLRSLRLRNEMMANEFADKDADLLLGETQSPQRAQRNAKRVGVGLDVCDARDEGCLRSRKIGGCIL